MNLRAAVAGLAIALSACVNPFAIDPSQAEGDARQAIARGDHRLVGVYGFAAEAPGATHDEMDRLGVRFIENTSDFHRSLGEAEYNARARKYAERYNAVILAVSD